MNIAFPHNAVLFNSSRPIELMFYTNCIAYSHIPDKTLIKSLHKSDYKLYIIEDGTLPLEIMEDKKITKMKLHGIKAN